MTRGRGAAFAGVALPFLDARDGALVDAGTAAPPVRGGVSLYLEAFAVASTVSGLMRVAAPRSLRRRCSARRMRSFCVTALLVAAVVSHFASSSAIRTDFGVNVVCAIEFLLVVVVVNATGEPAANAARAGARASIG